MNKTAHKISIISDGQQCHQYQQNKQSITFHLNLLNIKHNTTNSNGNRRPGL
jgi:hypothetical protein